MQSGHSYAVQSAAFYLALVPFILLFTMMFGARYFESLRRKRKPLPPRPAIAAFAAFAPPRRALTSAE
jgi:hypothetical protein